MDKNRTKRQMAYRATKLLALLLLYLASVGPASWVNRWVTGPGIFNEVCKVVYAPVWLTATYAPQPVRDAMAWYARLWNV